MLENLIASPNGMLNNYDFWPEGYGASSSSKHDPDGHARLKAEREYQLPVDSPSTPEDILDRNLVDFSDFGYSNENNAKYQNYDYFDDYLNMVKKGADIGLFATAQNVVDEADRDRAFQALEAEKNRAWYENMSDTAYQRQIKDLEAAGLNPILGWAHSGVGAPTAMASSASGRATNLQAQAPSLSDYINAAANLISSASDIVDSVTGIKKLIPKDIVKNKIGFGD